MYEERKLYGSFFHSLSLWITHKKKAVLTDDLPITKYFTEKIRAFRTSRTRRLNVLYKNETPRLKASGLQFHLNYISGRAILTFRPKDLTDAIGIRLLVELLSFGSTLFTILLVKNGIKTTYVISFCHNAKVMQKVDISHNCYWKIIFFILFLAPLLKTPHFQTVSLTSNRYCGRTLNTQSINLKLLSFMIEKFLVI